MTYANKVRTGCVVNSFVVCSVFWLLVTAKHTVLSKNHKTHNITKAERENRLIFKYLFTKYGSIDRMTFEGYEHLLHRLQLGNIAFDHDLVKHTKYEGSDFKDFHPSHDHRERYKQGEYKDEEGHVRHDGHTHDDMYGEDHEHNRKSNRDHAHDKNNDHTHNDKNSGDHEHKQNDHSHNDKNSRDHEHKQNDHSHNDKNSGDHAHKKNDHSHNDKNSGDHVHKKNDHSHNDKNSGEHVHDNNTDHTHIDKNSGDNVHDKKNDHTHNDKNNGVHTQNKSSEHIHNHEQTGVHTHNKSSEHTHNDKHSGVHIQNKNMEHRHNDKNNGIHTHNKSSKHTHNDANNRVHTHDKNSEHRHNDKNNGDHVHNASTEHTHSDKNNGVHTHHNITKHTHDRHQLAHGEKNQTGYSNHRQKRNLPHVNEDITVFQKCLTPEQILDLYGYKKESGVTQEQFLQMCPTIVAQIENHKCDYTFRKNLRKHDHSHEEPKSRATGAVWGYGCAAVAVISASGLLSVSAISAVHKMSVAGILQFFVSLAVGALTGDALLHLLPHAFESAAHDHGSETPTEGHGIDGVVKGLCGMGIILLFFLFGRIQSIIADMKLRKKLKETNADSSFKFTEVVTVLDEKNEKIDTLLQELEENSKSDPLIEKHNHHSYEHNHGHSNGDGEVPSTPGAMVWRIIVGDGIHNFSDGLAIGVSFSDSVTGGLSTAIAVLCHELPHEMGDFAVLLKKGMSVKHAIMYNCLSSVLSLIGVLVGIAVGNIQSVNLYVFVCIAAMFLYISLVDMLPEISVNTDRRPIRQLIIQVCGIMLGCTIMLIIALKENDLKKIVG